MKQGVFRPDSIMGSTEADYFKTMLPDHKVNVWRLHLKCDGTCAETRFRLSVQRSTQFKSVGGCQFSRLLAAKLCASVVVMMDSPCSEVV
jgi:hypothetical protein